MSDTNTETALVRATPIDLSTLDAPEAIKARCLSIAAQMAGNLEGFEDQSGDWRPPVLKIVQPVTQDPAKPEDAKNGDFFAKTGAVKRPLKGVLAYVWYSRSYYTEEQSCRCENVDTKAQSKAEDRSINVYGESCAKCPFSVHPRDGFKKDKTAPKKQLCQNITNVIFVADDMEGVYHLQFKGASSQVGRQLVDMARANGTPWAKLFSLDTEQKKRDGGGLYYVFKATPLSTPVPAWLKTVAVGVKDYFTEYRNRVKAEVRTRSDEVREVIQVDSISDAELEVKAAKKGVKDDF